MDFRTRIESLRTRHGLSDAQMARLLGCPVTTATKWLRGERSPSASAARLLDVLVIVETMAPGMFAALITPDPPRRKKPKP